MVSIVIPSRNERFLNKTVDDLLAKAQGHIEIFVVLEGYWLEPGTYNNDPRVNYIHFEQARGMRNAINTVARISRGDFLMKIDAHCMVSPGFDVELAKNCEDNWIVIPRRKRLEPESWSIQDVGKPDVDYEYLSWPGHTPLDPGLHGAIWNERAKQRLDYFIDENMSFQGSCWFMSMKHWRWLGEMQEEGYGSFKHEAQEIGLKTWLGGGKVMTNKTVWYAHLHKGKKYGRGYFFDRSEADMSRDFANDYWINNRWERRIHDLSWLIERFWPVPTWPEDRSLWTRWPI